MRKKFLKTSSALAMALLGLMLLSTGCSGGGELQAGAAPLSCAQLSGMAIAATAIGLPTTGAIVIDAHSVPPAGTGAAAIGEYCQVKGEINPVDPAAPKIKFQLDLPGAWNHKALMFGGGGYNGTVPDASGNVPAGPLDMPKPLARGYATFASDSGHQANQLGSRDGSFGQNDEALQNFAGDALKKTHDVALYLIKQYYAGALPQKSYFAGGSTGGREALAVAQRWPQDWDGVIVLYPAWAAASLDLQFGRITRAFAMPGAYLNLAKRKVLYDAALQACDALDGVRDGLISNMQACNGSFDPATATLNGAPLRCAGGIEAVGNSSDNCLSDAQIAALKTYGTAISFNSPLGSGETQYPGFNVWGADLGLAGDSAAQKTVRLLAMGDSQPAQPMPTDAPYWATFWDQWVKYFVTRNPASDSLSFDPQQPGAWKARVDQLTILQDVNKTDLSAFRARGGKILMAHGMSDALVSTRSSEDYFRRLQSTMGSAEVAGFVRYYEIPGYGHSLSTVFNAAWDSLTALENWVEQGKAPVSQVVADTAGIPGRTRPLCEFPAWPKYSGAGDINLAASFSCATQ
ncbi:tannase/feruloyl esterase family alpha/beta hydrolase [Collimonas pratensis]|uniref:Tannase and feruloyl esterase family protein n=1 Tax=Collimonas pratensis TaxID=279113 RepID=A0A127PZK5_9BURK|nr:tannase/feruloyl esterase family alpha/beta hydrolase [Collimonas pratensis]AMP03186.1 tannase and feruloyl esterase family protein [Collimonas pratensis]